MVQYSEQLLAGAVAYMVGLGVVKHLLLESTLPRPWEVLALGIAWVVYTLLKDALTKQHTTTL